MSKEITTPHTLRVDTDPKARSFEVSVWETHEFVNGERVKLKKATKVEGETFYLADLPEEILGQLELKGAAAVLGQRTSGIKDDPIEKLAGQREVWKLWEDGKYEKPREGGPREFPAIVEVLAKLKKATAGATQKSWNALPEDTKAALRKKYADEVKAVEDARAKTEGPDLTDLA